MIILNSNFLEIFKKRFYLSGASGEISLDGVVGSNFDQIVDVAGSIQVLPDRVAHLNK